MIGMRCATLSLAFFQPLLVFGINVRLSNQETSCAKLENHETYSAVKVAIGSPPQMFSLVADTGSNSCIVKDCQCQHCPAEWGKCFTGPDHSRSFVLPTFKSNASTGHLQGQKGPASMIMSFGSGEIAAQIASDEVRVGRIKAYMDKGLLLMVDHALKLQGQFEGILGLGRPDFKEKQDGSSQEESMVHVPGFFDRAHVQRFSMCFNRNADGVLGINTPPHPNALSSVGKLHWGLDFQGISIGDQKMQVSFCDPKSKEAGMETACGIIPDSGTTLIAGPEMQLGMLFEAVCNGWQRCKDTQAKLQEELQDLRKRGMAVDQGDGMGTLAFIQQEPTEFLDLVERVIRPEGLGVGIQEERGPPEAGIKTLEHPGLPMRPPGFVPTSAGAVEEAKCSGTRQRWKQEHFHFSRSWTAQILRCLRP
ncbi:Aspartic proteinase A1 [Durusdinium trenchii]|uniref:Aspartic proteinase A1 n=1 Tax=Durusdinium trenchii TaxID=1381693 RepID=A0ABP0Q8P4_9DINO